MAQKRLTRKLVDVIVEVEAQLKAHYGVTQEQLDAWRIRAQTQPFKFPVSTMVAIEDLWIDYEVQRDVLYKHIINIMKKWDPRVCSPGSACRTTKANSNIYLYDAQHRTVAAGLLGFTQIPCAIVIDDDVNFASYAFELLNDTGVNDSLLETYTVMRWYVTKMAVEIPKWFVLESCKISLMPLALICKTKAAETVPHCVATTNTS